MYHYYLNLRMTVSYCLLNKMTTYPVNGQVLVSANINEVPKILTCK